MLVCPSCGRENADDASFCSGCATPLAAGEGVPREERKVITCLFCDLVGFTARAERMDPEDVRRVLQPYHARLRSELERFGGTVEKFIGDAVMAVFGAPIAHEDDPERAVRAALSIRDDLLADPGELDVRIGITTGEALIALGARPEAGEGMASGDVVNTAARLQTAAPTNGILVDETTYRATERAIEYGDERAIEAKGKTKPIAVREAVRARARVGVERVGGAQLVGRAQELTLLRETLARVVREREPQLVTLVGVPGIGKSRLVFELFETIQTGAFGLVYWRHGRSLPYGEGVTFWALGEMVKAQAGILESDPPAEAGEKLRRAVGAVVSDEADASWVERHLQPLAGLERSDDVEHRRDEAFAAWRRFLEAIADERPLVLVFEDLQWADGALLDFVDHLLDWASGVPLLVLCTARPELMTRRADWGGGKVNSSTILVSPLSEDETATLVHELLGRAAIDASLQARLLEHAGGNPLYAEEFTRMHLERPTTAVVPESVQGMIAARLDTLSAEEKELLQDAAVIGKVFWLGALGGERWTLEDRLHSLARKEFVSRERRSIVSGEVEYAFRHALVRDVAYEQIPRARRADKHRRAAEWIESLGRVEDHAEMLAHHYGSALEYARATGADADAFAERARGAFQEAGDRAFALQAFGQAALFYERALELWAADAPPELLLRYGRTLAVSDDERGTVVLERALDGLLAAGRHEAAAEAHAFLTEALHMQGDRDAAYEHSERAFELVRDAPASAAKARVLTESSRLLALDEQQLAFTVGQDAYEMALELGLVELAARAMCNLGLAKTQVMDFDGAVTDLERSRELARSVGSPEEARACHNLGSATFFRGNLKRATGLFEEAAGLGRRFGTLQLAFSSSSVHCTCLCTTGAWDESLQIADKLIAQLERGGASYFEYHLRYARSRIGLARGAADEFVLADARRAVEVSHSAKDRQALIPMLSNLAFVAAELGELDEAEAAGRELSPLLADASPINVHRIMEIAYVARSLHGMDELRRLAREAPEGHIWRDVVLALLDLDFERAAAIQASIGHADEGYARLRAGELHLREGRRSEAVTELSACIAFHRRLGATRFVRRAEELLSGAGLQVSA